MGEKKKKKNGERHRRLLRGGTEGGAAHPLEHHAYKAAWPRPVPLMEPQSPRLGRRGGAAASSLPVTYAQYWTSIVTHPQDCAASTEDPFPRPQTAAPVPAPPPPPRSPSPCRLTVAGAYRLHLTLTPSPHKGPRCTVGVSSRNSECVPFGECEAEDAQAATPAEQRDRDAGARQANMASEKATPHDGLRARAGQSGRASRLRRSGNKDLVDSPPQRALQDEVVHAEKHVGLTAWHDQDAVAVTSARAAADVEAFSDDYAADELILQAARCYEEWRRCWMGNSGDTHIPGRETSCCVVEVIHVGESAAGEADDAVGLEERRTAFCGGRAPVATCDIDGMKASDAHTESTLPMALMQVTALPAAGRPSTSPDSVQNAGKLSVITPPLRSLRRDELSPASLPAELKHAVHGCSNSISSARRPPQRAAGASTDSQQGLTSNRRSPAELSEYEGRVRPTLAAATGAASASSSVPSLLDHSSGHARHRPWNVGDAMDSCEPHLLPLPPPRGRVTETRASSAPAHAAVRSNHAPASEALTRPAAHSPPGDVPDDGQDERASDGDSGWWGAPWPGVEVHRRLFDDDDGSEDGEAVKHNGGASAADASMGEGFVEAERFSATFADGGGSPSRAALPALPTSSQVATPTGEWASTTHLPSPAQRDRGNSGSSSSTSACCAEDEFAPCGTDVARASPVPGATVASEPPHETLIELSTSTGSSSSSSTARSESLSRCSSIHSDALGGSALTGDDGDVAMPVDEAAASVVTECVNLSAVENEAEDGAALGAGVGDGGSASPTPAAYLPAREEREGDSEPAQWRDADAADHRPPQQICSATSGVLPRVHPLLHPAALRARHGDAVTALYSAQLLPGEKANEEIALFLCWSQEVAERQRERWCTRPLVSGVPDGAAEHPLPGSTLENVQRVYTAAYARAPRGHAKPIAPEARTRPGRTVHATEHGQQPLQPAVYVAAPLQSSRSRSGSRASSSAQQQGAVELQRADEQERAASVAPVAENLLTPSATPARFVQWIAQDIDPYAALLLRSL